MSLAFKSYCWSLGTTSFRMRNFNEAIERQLIMLQRFWDLPQNSDAVWAGNDAIQEDYYNFIHEDGFITGSAANKPKDAREKTSGLVDFGLIDNNRQLTPAGMALLECVRNGDFEANNEMHISADAYIYLKQLLKMSININNGNVRPFPVILMALNTFGHISKDEFTYLLPLCINPIITKIIFSRIEKLRANNDDIDNIIIDSVMSMQNYKDALDYFITNDVSESVICNIGLNRKSREYDIAYYNLYLSLKKLFLDDDFNIINIVIENLNEVRTKKLWRSFLFTPDFKAKNPKRNELASNILSRAKNEEEFKKAFFKTLHLLKIKQNLYDYRDLNQRYIKTANIILFQDEQLLLDILPASIFADYQMALEQIAFSPAENIFQDCPMEQILRGYDINMQKLLRTVNEQLGTQIASPGELTDIIEKKRLERFNMMIRDKYNDEQLVQLLECFKIRKDKDINEFMNCEANIPTIFEYIVAIIWYKISNYQGNILQFMRLSLDANLMPVSHASGGDADIVYRYSKSGSYPAHVLLLEATLTEGTNQRRAEMEPISRHLGLFLLNNPHSRGYCIFIANFIDINVVADFRSRKNCYFYDTRDYSRHITEMKIIPLTTDNLITIINKKIDYQQLYQIFEFAYQSNAAPHLWLQLLAGQFDKANV